MKRTLLPFLATAALAACNTTSEGDSGNVGFTPDNCGRVGCDFEDSIGVGGKVDLHIQGLEGVSTAGADVFSDDSDVLTVTPIADTGGSPTWELQGISPGVARLEVYDSADALLDTLEVGVQDLTDVGAVNVLGDAVGPADDPNLIVDEVWTINANSPVSFQVTPFIGDGVQTMGRYDYTATIDQGIQDGLLDDDVSEGYLYFEVPAGEYQADFVDDFGHSFSMLIVAEEPAN